MKINHYLCLLIGLACLIWSAPVAAQEQEERVDPMEDLHRDAVFIDSTELPLANKELMNKLLSENPAAGYFCFAETREREIRILNQVPQIWAERPVAERTQFRGTAQPGEYYPWQVGVFTPYKALTNLRITFTELSAENGTKIPTSAMECFNMGGTDMHGQPLTKVINVEKGYLQVLWNGIEVPKTARGTYRGQATIQANGVPATTIDIFLTISGEVLENGGRDESWRKSRIKWLNSKIGFAETPTAPYTALKHDGQRISYLGGSVELTPEGLPHSITNHYTPSNQLDPQVSNSILAKPISFIVETSKGIEKLKPTKITFLKQTDATSSWNVVLKGNNVEVNCLATMLFDGSIEYKMNVHALQRVEVKDIRTEIDLTHYASKYLMGLGHRGGPRPDSTITWKWDTVKQQDKVWIGNINAGLNMTFKDSNYKRPLVNIYYHFGPLQYPNSWGNDNKGGINITPQGKATRVSAYSGQRTMQKGDSLTFNFDLMITPVKPIILSDHFSDRVFHLNADTSGSFIPRSLQTGAKMINVHHKADIYPYINYPMVDEVVPDMRAFVAKAHANDLKVRLYYTCRELTVKTPEFWALRSLGNEIFCDGPGNDTRTIIYEHGPRPWFIHNLREKYIPAWYAGFKFGKYKGKLDIAVLTSPESRWNNYYLEGLDWMIKNIGIDGIYIDDSSLDAPSLRRARRIFDADGKRRLVDMHTWNHMNSLGGYANSIGLYTHHLPYVDRLWIGELARDNSKRDCWLIEMSGIPFGLMSEMLDAHNIHRGMVFGMLPRLPWSGNPVPVWKLLDSFGVQKAAMYGYWDERTPITSNNELMPVTTYLKYGEAALVSMANWDDKDAQTCLLKIDEKKLGFHPSKIYLPEINQLQPAGEINLNGEITLPATKGHIIILQK